MSEAQEQERVIQWAAYMESKYPCLKWLFHIANGGKRNYLEAVKFKRQGVKAGVSDLFLPYYNGVYHGLFIEMKAENGKVSKKQQEFIDDMNDSLYKAVVCYSADSAIDTIEDYLRGY